MKSLGLFGIDLEAEMRAGPIPRDVRQTLIVLSAPPVINLVPVWSNVDVNTPASASNDPGCGISSKFWNGVPVL